MKRNLLIVVFVCFGVGLLGRHLFERFTQPSRAHAYVEAFAEHCLPRIAARREGTDRYSSLPKGEAETFLITSADLELTQTNRKCTINDAPKLLSYEQHLAALDGLRELIETRLPDLSAKPDPQNFAHFEGWISPHSYYSGLRWGVLIIQIKADTGDALQHTTASLMLPPES